jgi:hypothetical protein
MLEFLKKIFRSEESQSNKKLMQMSLQNIEEWLNERSKPLMDDVQQQAGQILMKVNEELQRSRFNIEVLENAKLQNPDIPFKAKQYMEGNRKAYVRSVSSFLGHMEINNRDYFYLLGFCRAFDELIGDLNKGTLRSYTILQEFFAHEAGKIAQNLKNFDNLFSELKTILNNEKLVALNGIMEKIKSLKMKAKQKINIGVDSKNAEASLKLAVEEKNSIISEIEKFSASEEHSRFLSLNEDRKSKSMAFYEDENAILQSFSSLERALRKYSHIAFGHEEIILDYLKNPIVTLANDKNLVIFDILKNLEKALVENKIQIDGKKKEKSLEEIRRLDREFLERFVKKYFSFKSEMEELENRIKATGVAEKFRNFNKQLEDSNLRIEKNGQEFEKLGNDAARLNGAIAKLNDEIENGLGSIFNEEIKIAY